MDDRRIAVVVPYYQRDKGILSRALHSIARQTLPGGTMLRVIVVDDSSPLPAAEEARDFKLEVPHSLEIVRQENAGPGGARNRALDMIASSPADFVAFLDSDDEWKPDHLRDALDALSQGHDFYFCDHERPGLYSSGLEQWEGFKALQGDDSPRAPMFAGEHGSYHGMTGPAATEAFVLSYLSHTSTVVYRFAAVPRLRFDIELRSAGEDHLFWIQLAHRSRSVAFSEKKNVICGDGVNIYFSSMQWGAPANTLRYGYHTMFDAKLSREFPAVTSNLPGFKAQRQRNLKIYAYLLMRGMAKRQPQDWSILKKLARLDPAALTTLPYYVTLVLIDKVRGKRL